MTQLATKPEETASVSSLSDDRRLPRYAPWLILAASVVVVFGLLAALHSLNVVGAAVLSVIVYALAITVISAVVEGGRWAKDRLATTLVTSAFLCAVVPLVSLIYTVLVHGIKRFNPFFLSHSMNGVFGGMDAGGAYHAILGTLLVTLGAAIISVPVGILTAVYLVEYGAKNRLARAITFFVDVMTGIPSIVAGLFAFSLFVLIGGPEVRSGLMGSVALSVLMIPTVVRSTEEMLRLVSPELREASYALGVPKWLTITKVVLPTAVAGIVTGVTLAIARVIGETAPLLVTAGYVDYINPNLFSGRMTTLPVMIYTQYAQGLVPCRPGAHNCIASINYDRAWAAALCLILIVMVLNILARLVSKFFSPKGAR